MQNEPLFLGRQPILDRDQKMVAFELLFRSDEGNNARIGDDFTATATVINHAINEFGLESALGPYMGFINVSESLLMSDVIEILPKDKIVLEILETVKVNHALIERCKLLKASGFNLALDDFVEYTEELEPLIEMADIVKIDILAVEAGKLADLARMFRNRSVRLLAEKVDSIEQFEKCKALGFNLFQGYYFAKPHVIRGKRLSPSEITLMKLVSLVTRDAEEHEIEDTLKENPMLSLNLLRLTNSVACGARQKTTSIRSAITILGRRQLQRWLQLLLYSNSGGGETSPLLQLAAMRGRLMELLSSKKQDREFQENGFMTGIMSLMETLLSMPMAEILSTLSLNGEIQDALMTRSGELGKLLSLAESMEKGELTEIESCLEQCSYLTLHDLNMAQSEALKWSNAIALPQH